MHRYRCYLTCKNNIPRYIPSRKSVPGISNKEQRSADFRTDPSSMGDRANICTINPIEVTSRSIHVLIPVKRYLLKERVRYVLCGTVT
jgi:hypothetical protein